MGSRLTLDCISAILAALDARLDLRVYWRGPELDRMLDSAHAALQAAVKRHLERWGWAVRVEVSFSQYGERGRIDLMAWHPITRNALVIEIKTDLVDVQALLGSQDVKTRLARQIAARIGWEVGAVVPAIVFIEDRTIRRRLADVNTLFDRYSSRGRQARSWMRRPVGVPSGLLWFMSLPNARVARVSGQRVRRRRSAAAVASVKETS
jgi:hypothetical protein